VLKQVTSTTFASEKRLMAVTRVAGVNGPSTLTFIGTVWPLSASCGSVSRTRSETGLRPARNAVIAGICGNSSAAACPGIHGKSASAAPDCSHRRRGFSVREQKRDPGFVISFHGG